MALRSGLRAAWPLAQHHHHMHMHGRAASRSRSRSRSSGSTAAAPSAPGRNGFLSGALLASVEDPPSAEAAAQLLVEGPGVVLYRNAMTGADLAAARERVATLVGPFRHERELPTTAAPENGTSRDYNRAGEEARTAAGTYEFAEDTGHSNIYAASQETGQALQGIRLWNLVEKGEVFERLVQHELAMRVGRRLLGSDFCLGSFAANFMAPGSVGQSPHLDYPYWDYNSRPSWPASPKEGPSHGFVMNLQAVFALDDFTPDNGATAVLPHSQLEARWPSEEEFAAHHRLVPARAGDMFLFTGLLHHAATSNASGAPRSALLAQYLPKYVRPMEDMADVGAAVRARATPTLAQLLGTHQPYPKTFQDG